MTSLQTQPVPATPLAPAETKPTQSMTQGVWYEVVLMEKIADAQVHFQHPQLLKLNRRSNILKITDFNKIFFPWSSDKAVTETKKFYCRVQVVAEKGGTIHLRRIAKDNIVQGVIQVAREDFNRKYGRDLEKLGS